MSSNPNFEVKDLVSATLNNLDKQTTDLISVFDGYFSSEVGKDVNIIREDGTIDDLTIVENLAFSNVQSNPEHFWDQGTNYYFQSSGERLRDISEIILEKIEDTNVDDSLSNKIREIVNDQIESSMGQVSGASFYSGATRYENLYDKPDSDSLFDNTQTNLNDFFSQIDTSIFGLLNDATDGGPASSLENIVGTPDVTVDFNGIEQLIDDGDNFYNDSIEAGVHNNLAAQESYFLEGKITRTFAKNDPAIDPDQRLDFTSNLWNDGSLTDDEVMYGMLAITLTATESVDISSTGGTLEERTRAANMQTMTAAKESLDQQAALYILATREWYDADPADRESREDMPDFTLYESDGVGNVIGPIDFDSDPRDLSEIIADNSSLDLTTANDVLNDWDNPAYSSEREEITKYYAQSLMFASMESSFASSSGIATKNIQMHNVIQDNDPSTNPFLTDLGEDNVDVDLNSFLAWESANVGHLRGTDQFSQLTDIFLENFDIRSPKYIEDNRTLVDLFTGKLNTAPGDNSALDETLFQSISDASNDITNQTRNLLTRGIDGSADNQLMLDLFNQTAVRVEDYGPNYFPDNWENKKEQYEPAIYSTITDISDPNYVETSFDPVEARLPTGFPVMDLRDFEEYFTILSNELGKKFGEVPLDGDPSFADAGYAATSVDSIFGTFVVGDNSEAEAKAILMYEQLQDILTQIEPRVEQLERGIGDDAIRPRDGDPSLINDPENGVSYNFEAEGGDSNLVRIFLDSHEDTSTLSSELDQMSFLVNMFSTQVKFTQEKPHEKLYAAQQAEANKINARELYRELPGPRADGTMPEDDGIPKPLVSPSSSALLIGQVGQILVDKVNQVVSDNNIAGISVGTVDTNGDMLVDANDIRSNGDGTGEINLSAVEISGSDETQQYLNNVLEIFNNFVAPTNIQATIDAMEQEIFDPMQETLINFMNETNKPEYEMAYMDADLSSSLINLRDELGTKIQAAIDSGQYNPTDTNGDASIDAMDDPVYRALMEADLDFFSDRTYYKKDALSVDQQNFFTELEAGTIGGINLEDLVNGSTIYSDPNFPPIIFEKTLVEDMIDFRDDLQSEIQNAIDAGDYDPGDALVDASDDPMLKALLEADLDSINFGAATDIEFQQLINSGSPPPTADVIAARETLFADMLDGEIGGIDEDDFTTVGDSIYADLYDGAYNIPSLPLSFVDDLADQDYNPINFNYDFKDSEFDSYTLSEILGDPSDPDSILGLKNQMLSNPANDTVENRKDYIKKMQHFQELFYVLAGGVDNGTYPTFHGFNTVNKFDLDNDAATSNQTLMNQLTGIPYRDADIVASADTINNVTEQFKAITDNLNGLSNSFDSQLKKPKNDPESDTYSSLHLLTQIDSQVAGDGNYEAGLLQILDERLILDHNGVAASTGKGYVSNFSTLPTGTIDINNELSNQGIAIPPNFAAYSVTDYKDFLTALDNVYETIEDSSDTDQKNALDQWLGDNAISKIAVGTLSGKDALEADINLLNHFIDGSIENYGSVSSMDSFIGDIKTNMEFNLEEANNIDNFNVTINDFVESLAEGSLPDFGDGSAIDIFTTEIFNSTDNSNTLTDGYPFKSPLSVDGLPLEPEYQKIFEDVEALLIDKQNANFVGNTATEQMIDTMIINLLVGGEAPSDEMVDAALDEHSPINRPSVRVPGHSSLQSSYSNGNSPDSVARLMATNRKDELDEIMDPENVDQTGVVDKSQYSLTDVINDSSTDVRDESIGGKSVQELLLIMFVLQMFEQSKWEWEQYLNDESRYS